MFISKLLLPLEDHKDTVITQNCVRRRKLSLYIYQSSAEVEWKWDRTLLYFAVCSPPGPDPAKPFNICFALSLFLDFIPMQEGICQGNVPVRALVTKRAENSPNPWLLQCRIAVCSTWDQLSALRSAQDPLILQMLPGFRRTTAGVSYSPMWVRGWESGSLGFI